MLLLAVTSTLLHGGNVDRAEEGIAIVSTSDERTADDDITGAAVLV